MSCLLWHMKRQISLVSYESSDENGGDADIVAAESSKSLKRKLPKVSQNLIIPGPVDDPALHQGRIRSAPHVEGQFAAFVYITVPLARNSPLREILEKAVHHAKAREPALVCDWLEHSSTPALHISLTRPIYLRHHQREELKRTVKAAARTIRPFTASFSCFATFENDERTRAFLGVEVGAGHREMESLSKSIEPTLKLYRQKEFYAEPRFHASIAWALLKTANGQIVEKLGAPIPDPDHTSMQLHVISSPLSSLLPEINARFGQSLSNKKVGSFEAERICVKIGKDVFSWNLGLD